MSMATGILSSLSEQQIIEALAAYTISPTEDQVKKIREYVALLLRWNRSISLTSITEPREIVGRHFGESMYAAKIHPVENCRLADVGTGAGFPGLALKIICPSTQLTLIESNRKKAAFLKETAGALGLDVEILSERFEDIRASTMSANTITARAVGQFAEMLAWSREALVQRGHVLLWVGGEDAARIARTPGWNWMPAAHIPDSQRRFILIGRPIERTPAQG